ncbi:MAG: TolC family protein [Cyclobacteriaceae bacterium]|nr:TolC family protein [Cyclobacteriaceae bacterium]MDH4297314.1 TolC family protein [Cyclobacteriaceae bacterium]MDH5247767.1 TolC family protein [Cyclobacteriaceae bacterium]
MKRIASLLFGLVFLVSLTGTAQQADTLTNTTAWTLKQCIDYALANSLNVQRSTYNVETGEVNYNQAKMSLLPSLNANLNYGYNWGRSVNPVTNQFTTQQINFTSPGASSSVMLFNGLRIQSILKQNARDYKASVEDLQKTKNDVSLNIAFLFVNVIFSKEQLENAKYQLSSSQQQLDQTKKQVAAGALPISNELNLEAQVATNELTVITNENALTLALLQLKQALQLPASVPLDVVVPDLNVEDLILDQDRNEIYEMAHSTLPEIRAARLRIESADYAVKAAKGNLYPRLSLSGSINTNYSSASDRERFVADGGDPTITYPQIGVVGGPGGTPVYSADPVTIPSGAIVDGYGRTDQLKDNIFRQVSLGLSIPIFNGLQSKAAYQRSVINRQLAAVSAKEIDNTLRQNVETAYNDALAASKTYSSSLKQVRAREEAFRMTKQRFDLGAVPYVEYQVAENDLFKAKSDLVRAKYDFIMKKKVLDFYQGKPLDY